MFPYARARIVCDKSYRVDRPLDFWVVTVYSQVSLLIESFEWPALGSTDIAQVLEIVHLYIIICGIMHVHVIFSTRYLQWTQPSNADVFNLMYILFIVFQ